MPTAYLVRLMNSRDLVGFFVAEDLNELIDLIDEGTDPGACEYLELPSGGIFWDSPAVAIPIEADENDDPKASIPWSKADLTWSWSGPIFVDDEEEQDWMPLFADEPETTKRPRRGRPKGI